MHAHYFQGNEKKKILFELSFLGGLQPSES